MADIDTVADYREYQKAIEASLQGLIAVSTGDCPDCQECADAYGMDLAEYNASYEACNLSGDPSFSWSSCAVCGSSLGGNREPVHAVNEKNEVVHLDGACEDCVYYLEYGRLDDTTMMRLGLDE
jgi:hypothetical protein